MSTRLYDSPKLIDRLISLRALAAAAASITHETKDSRSICRNLNQLDNVPELDDFDPELLRKIAIHCRCQVKTHLIPVIRTSCRHYQEGNEECLSRNERCARLCMDRVCNLHFAHGVPFRDRNSQAQEGRTLGEIDTAQPKLVS